MRGRGRACHAALEDFATPGRMRPSICGRFSSSRARYSSRNSADVFAVGSIPILCENAAHDADIGAAGDLDIVQIILHAETPRTMCFNALSPAPPVV